MLEIKGDELVKLNDRYAQNVVIPEGVRVIGNAAFKGSMIKSVEFPSTLEVIGYEAFRNCSLLESVIIPKNVKVVMDSAFENCCSLQSIYFEDGVKIIPADMCMDCTNLLNVHLPNTAQVIQKFAFTNCARLKDINLPKSLISIDSSAFCDSDYLLENLGLADMTFSKAYFADSNLQNLVFVEDYGLMYSEHHWWGSKIKRIIFGGDVKHIADIDASYLETLQEVIFPQNLKSIESINFSSCASLKEFRAPLCLTHIDSLAFSSCGKLEKVVLGDKFESVDSFAFEYCVSLKQINLPKGYYPEDNVFDKCEYVNSIRCHHENLTSSIPFTKPTPKSSIKVDESNYDLSGIEFKRKIVGAQLVENGSDIQVKPIYMHYMINNITDLSYVCYNNEWYKFDTSDNVFLEDLLNITFEQLCQDQNIDGNKCYSKIEKMVKNNVNDNCLSF